MRRQVEDAKAAAAAMEAKLAALQADEALRQGLSDAVKAGTPTVPAALFFAPGPSAAAAPRTLQPPAAGTTTTPPRQDRPKATVSGAGGNDTVSPSPSSGSGKPLTTPNRVVPTPPTPPPTQTVDRSKKAHDGRRIGGATGDSNNGAKKLNANQKLAQAERDRARNAAELTNRCTKFFQGTVLRRNSECGYARRRT